MRHRAISSKDVGSGGGGGGILLSTRAPVSACKFLFTGLWERNRFLLYLELKSFGHCTGYIIAMLLTRQL